MKIAKKSVAAFYLTCPHCKDGHLSHPDTGSHMWTPYDIENNETATCDDCGIKSKTRKDSCDTKTK